LVSAAPAPSVANRNMADIAHAKTQRAVLGEEKHRIEGTATPRLN
jgi:hypothetical protein